MSGFDSLQECFEELTPHIFAVETGLSSDPPMNWRITELDNRSIVSFSDAHSPANIGREATVFELKEKTYQAIAEAIRQKNADNKIDFTIEFYPEEGMYHWDGHRNCEVRLSPAETKKYNGICPVCGKKVTVGVMNRVDALATRPEGYDQLVINGKNEFNILLNVPVNELKNMTQAMVAEGVQRVREGKLQITPGYDGTYGIIKVFSDEEREKPLGQSSLF